MTWFVSGSTCALALLLSAAPAAAQTIALDLAAPAATHIMPRIAPTGIVPETPVFPADLKGRSGSVDYAVSAAERGWYLLAGQSATAPHRLTVLVDPDRPGARRLPPPAWRDGRFLSGWVFLEAGPHRIRLENNFWTGFPDLREVTLQPARPADSNAFALLDQATRVFSAGACEPLVVETGANTYPFTLVLVVERAGAAAIRSTAVASPSAEIVRSRFDLPCTEAGDYRVEIRPSATSAEFKAIRFGYAVVDPAPVAASFRKGRLVRHIDAVATPPDFAVDPTSVVTTSAGSYRATGAHGFTPFSRKMTSARPSWLAYTLGGLQKDVPHILEMRYPDDARRSFVAAIKDTGPASYGVSTGVNTGQEWPLSHRMQTLEALFWPRTPDPRLVLLTVHDDAAALAGLDVFEAVQVAGDRPRAESRRRAFRIWNEEGLSFLDAVGLRDTPRLQEGVERWFASLSETGATMVSPTVLVYNFALYPSRYNLVFGGDEGDPTRLMLLTAERYGMAFVPQLHPRADELAWVGGNDDLMARLLLSKDGRTNLYDPSGQRRNVPPHYNPFDPGVQDWLVGVVGELADRYRDSKAFAGIDLRIMAWQNPTLNNLESLDWGYNAAIVRDFFRDGAMPYPQALAAYDDRDPAGARARYDLLVGTYRDRWIAWRCEKIAALYERIRDRVRAARPDLVLYSTLSGFSGFAFSDLPVLREVGIDPERLHRIEGFHLIDGRTTYGRREAGEPWARELRQEAMEAGHYAAFRTEASGPYLTHPMQYIEAVATVVPPTSLGFPATQAAGWTSAALEPPGRLALERFATALGLSDAVMLGWGGNGYARLPPVTRDFIRAFTHLPALPFDRLSSPSDSVAVWNRPGQAYAVNMQPFPVTARLTATPGAEMRLAGSRAILALDRSGTAIVDLKPFDLVVLEIGRDGTVTTMSAEVPEATMAAYRRSVDEAMGRTDQACADAAPAERRGLCDAQRNTARRARDLLETGKLWEARRILEGAAFNERAAALGSR